MDGVGQLDTAPATAAAAVGEATQPAGIDATADPASTNGSQDDTTSDSGDTAGDSAASPPAQSSDGPQASTPVAAAPSAQSPASRAGQLNVNLDIRVSSPGSNGAVTQQNAASGPTPVQAPTDTTRGEQAAPPIAARPAAPSATAGPDTGWYWQWDCVSDQGIGAISPPVSSTGSIPSSWTWIWNCGDNSAQYQPETSEQYQQINANISIRIGSPGDDGPVTQSNIAGVSIPRLGGLGIPSVGVAIPSIVVDTAREITVTIPTISRDSWEPPSATPIVVGVDAVLATLPALTDLPEDWTTIGEDAVLALDEPLALGAAQADSALLATAPGTAPSPAGQSIVVIRPGAATLGTAGAGTFATARPDPTAWSPYAEISSRKTRTSPQKARPERDRPAPRWQPASDLPPAGGSAPTSGATAAAAGPGSTPGVGLPTFLALLLFAAVLDLARRVALDRVMLPSGHWRRPPDTPG